MQERAITIIRTNYNTNMVKNCWLEMCRGVYQNLYSRSYSSAQCALDIFVTEKHVNLGGRYILEILACFYFHGPEKTMS